MSFSGWNDASSSATSTSDYIIDQIGGETFAEIEADSFYNFQQVRPMVYMNKKMREKFHGQRIHFMHV